MRWNVISALTVMASIAMLGSLACCTKAAHEAAWQKEILSDSGWNQAYTESEGARSGAGAPTAPATPPTVDEMEAWTSSAEPAPGRPSAAASVSPQAFLDRTLDLERWFSPAAYAADNAVDEKYLIRTGNLSIKVAEYKKGALEVERIAKEYDATITNTSVSKDYNGMSTGYLTLRVPAEHFYEIWQELQQVGEVLDANTGSEDVSRQYISAISQLKNLELQQETLRGMLADAREVQRTRGLGEAYSVLLETQQRLAEVTGQIQTSADLVANLADQITRSTITVNLTEKVKLEKEPFAWGWDETLGKAGITIKYGLRDLSNGVLFFVLTAWMWLVPLALVVWVLWLIVRRLRRSRGLPRLKESQAPPEIKL